MTRILRCMLSACLMALAIDASASPRSFTVSDAIEMTVITSGARTSGFREPGGNFSVSPDRRWLVLATRRGDLATGYNEHELLRYSLAEIQEYVDGVGRGNLPKPIVLARFEARYGDEAISQVTWSPDSRSVLFIGRDRDSAKQIYKVDMDGAGQPPKQLTESTGDISRFAFPSNGRTLVYFAQAEPDTADRNVRGFVVEGENISDVLSDTGPKLGVMGRYFVRDLVDHKTTPLGSLQPASEAVVPVVSPDGSYAVILVSAETLPAYWQNYTDVAETYPDVFVGKSGTDFRRVAENPAFGSRFGWAKSLWLINLRTGVKRQLVDAPIPLNQFQYLVAWGPDGSHVAVGPTLRPYAECKIEDLKKCMNEKVLLEVDIASGTSDLITGIKAIPGFDGAYPGSGARYIDGNRLHLEYVTGWYGKRSSYRKHLADLARSSGKWQVRNAEPKPLSDSAALLTFRIIESNDVPPDLFAKDPGTGRERQITELNPKFRDIQLGSTRKIQWTDRLGRSFEGGLLVPPDYVAGKKYPLVIQTYGYDPDNFLVNGSNMDLTSGYASRPLAAQGILVLQVGCFAPKRLETGVWAEDAEPGSPMVCVDGAIDALVKQGIVDAQNLGVIGFSRMGMYVMHWVTYAKSRFKAATIADSIATSPWVYAVLYGAGRPGMASLEGERKDFYGMFGAPLWGSGVKSWVDHAPVFRLDRLHTAMRFEVYGDGFPGYWDVFAILSRMGRPAEYIRIPNEDHQLRSPWGRLTSQQGNVDWFRFWLKGEERTIPIPGSPEAADDLRQQYERWRLLRTEYEVAQESGKTPVH